MKNILAIMAILLTLSGCNSSALKKENQTLIDENILLKQQIDSLNTSAKDLIFEKNKECKSFEDRILEKKYSVDILMQIFYSPKLNSCLYVTRMEMSSDQAVYYIYDYFGLNLVKATSSYKILEEEIEKLK
jgi:hypothetical protein